MKRLAALALLALALALGACGGDDSEKFTKDYNEIAKDLDKVGKDIGDALGKASGQSNKQLAGEFEELSEATDKALGRLEELEAPTT